MRKNRIILIFGLIALVQIYVPAKMIWNREVVLSSGKEFKFRTAPIDPSDPFRGKYILLQYRENTFRINSKDAASWDRMDQPVYLLLSKDKNGFAIIHDVLKVKPASNIDFVKARFLYLAYVDSGHRNLVIEYPFSRFYMEESKAYEAEQVYNKSLVDTSLVTYGLVNIKDGEAVLRDVMIGSMSIKEIVKQRRAEGK